MVAQGLRMTDQEGGKASGSSIKRAEWKARMVS
jgi:hypothetical protein